MTLCIYDIHRERKVTMDLQATQVLKGPRDHRVRRDLPEIRDQLDPTDWMEEAGILEIVDPRDLL